MGSGFKDWAAGDVLTAADVDGYLMRQTVMTFADASARDTALSGVLDEGMVAYLEDTNEITVYDGSAWVIYAGRGYSYVQTVYFTSSGTFTKATYPWLRGIKVTVVGAGGGGGGAEATSAGESSEAAGGSGGGYAMKFITDIAGLSASETVTIGAGGSGGAAGNNNGTAGGSSSAFGLTATGGDQGEGMAATSSISAARSLGSGGAGSGGDINGVGDTGGSGFVLSPTVDVGWNNFGGGSIISGSVKNASTNSDGEAASANSGTGGSGGRNRNQNATAKAGGNGGSGIVIVELYA